MGEYYPYFFVGQLFVRTDLLVSMLDAPDVGDGDVQLDDPLIGEVGVGAHLVHFDFHGGGERQRFSGGTIALSARVGPPVVGRRGRAAAALLHLFGLFLVAGQVFRAADLRSRRRAKAAARQQHQHQKSAACYATPSALCTCQHSNNSHSISSFTFS